jgi:fumarate hydratase class I
MKHEPPVACRDDPLPLRTSRREEGDRWRVTAAGRRRASAKSRIRARSSKRYGVRAVIGKGGMGEDARGAQEHGAVYLNAIGAARFYARTITGVDDVSLLGSARPKRCGI